MSGKGSRKKTYDKEYSTLQKQRHQINKLKREKKQLENLIKDLQQELNKNKSLEELVEKQAKETSSWHDKRVSEKKKEKWLCHECGRDYLRIVILNRVDGPHYFRRCGNKLCSHKTKLKRYDPSVKGLKENPED